MLLIIFNQSGVPAPVITPVANFTGSPTSGTIPLLVTFTDQSSNTPTSWFWDFGDGDTSALQNPMHSYAVAGTYTVSLTATNSAGSDTKSVTDYITASRVPTPPAPSGFVGGAGGGIWLPPGVHHHPLPIKRKRKEEIEEPVAVVEFDEEDLLLIAAISEYYQGV